VGRIAAFVDASYREHTVAGPIGWIGLFECIDDDDVADALLDAATVDLKHQGAVKIIGPARFNANGEDGLLIDGFDKHPMVMEPYHPSYYTRFMERWGDKENDWYAFRITMETVQPYMSRLEEMRGRGQDLEKRLLREGIAVRAVRMRDWNSEIALVKTVYNQVWNTSVHPQFEQFSDEEFDYVAVSLRNLAIEDLVFVVEDISKPEHPVVAMSVTLPDLNEIIDEYDGNHQHFRPSRHTYGVSDLRRDLGILRLLRRRVKAKQFKYARIFVLGTMRKKSGIDALLYEKTYLSGRKMGIQLGSGSQIADSNPEIAIPVGRMGTTDLTWRVYRHKDRSHVTG
jgi:hypothetical protein